MQILNQPTEPTTKTFTLKEGPFKGMTFKNGPVEAYTGGFDGLGKLFDEMEKECACDRESLNSNGDKLIFQNSDQLAYWLYNKDVPIPEIPKCVSSRLTSTARQRWKSGSSNKTPPVIDSGWMKEKP